MKELEIKILEDVTNGTLDRNDILRRLLILYGVTERYFYHYSFVSRNHNGNIHTDELIEITKDFYDKLINDKESIEFHNPVKYMSNDIPKEKKIRNIIYTRPDIKENNIIKPTIGVIVDKSNATKTFPMSGITFRKGSKYNWPPDKPVPSNRRKLREGDMPIKPKNYRDDSRSK